jgi:hypothetical protein
MPSAHNARRIKLEEVGANSRIQDKNQIKKISNLEGKYQKIEGRSFAESTITEWNLRVLGGIQ